jgi:hypothetical protein
VRSSARQHNRRPRCRFTGYSFADQLYAVAIAAACLVGSTIELYDFFVYGTASALMLPTVFDTSNSFALVRYRVMRGSVGS